MKKKITWLLLTVLLCVAAAGCSDQNSSDQAEQEYCMYYINEAGNQVVYEEYMDNGLLTMDDLARMKRIIRGEEK